MSEATISVTIDAPEGLPEIKAILTCKPKDQAEFDAIVEAAGGPCAFIYHRPDGAHAKLADGTSLMVDAHDSVSFDRRPWAPSISQLKAACPR